MIFLFLCKQTKQKTTKEKANNEIKKTYVGKVLQGDSEFGTYLIKQTINVKKCVKISNHYS